MAKLSRRERECLRQCARHHALMDMPLNSEGAVRRLENLGLIERVPEIRAPIEALRCGYRPTPLGWSVLRLMKSYQHG